MSLPDTRQTVTNGQRRLRMTMQSDPITVRWIRRSRRERICVTSKTKLEQNLLTVVTQSI